ncbi:MAG TPA: TonB family protein [Terriglobales bacterium]|nr:TonB family protein [Terriglobales bacterium]
MPDEITGSSGSAEIILAKLRGMISAGRQETDAILGTIAVSAHALTGASGAAIAMPQAGVVICVGRSGDIAPELGDRLAVDSGISGECLRTGRIMRCDDAATDFHVNSEVCRQLNLQSIAAVPLRGQRGRVGLLEVFSSQSYAFTEEHMELLGRLAGLAETAWAQGPGAQEGLESQSYPVDDAPAAAGAIQADEFANKKPLADNSTAPTNVEPSLRLDLQAELPAERKRRYELIAGTAAILLVLLSVLGWKTWYKSSLPAGSTRPVGTLENAPDAASRLGPAWESGGEGSQPQAAPVRDSAAPPARGSAFAGQPPDTVIRREPRVGRAPDRSNARLTDSTAGGADLPPVAASGSSPTELQSLVPASPALPLLTGPISRGVSGGVLVHRVLPVYPSAARQSHVQGTVVLEGTVSERGQVEDLQVVSGPPLLAEAAMDAVRKWRYTPYLLNGMPVRKQTRINISFISPQ